MRLDTVHIYKEDPTHEILEFYMGNNTPFRQDFIMKNLREEVIMEDRAAADA